MGRHREFDPDDALEKAVGLFWRKGYAATSMADLVEEMGIGRGSMYGAFGTKEELFRAALERYTRRTIAEALEVLESEPDPLNGIRAALQATADKELNSPVRRGCLMVNTIAELAPHDPKISGYLQKSLEGLENALAEALRQAQAEGKLGKRKKPRTLARFLVCTLLGITLQSKYNTSRANLNDIVEGAMEAFA